MTYIYLDSFKKTRITYDTLIMLMVGPDSKTEWTDSMIKRIYNKIFTFTSQKILQTQIQEIKKDKILDIFGIDQGLNLVKDLELGLSLVKQYKV